MGRISKEQIEKNKENLLEALKKTLGNVSQACDMVGLSRMTYSNYKNDDKEFAEKVKDINERAIDFVESKLFKNIEKGKETSIIFFLKTKGKSRGYIERVENLNVEKDSFSSMTDDELREAIEKSKKNVKK